VWQAGKLLGVVRCNSGVQSDLLLTGFLPVERRQLAGFLAGGAGQTLGLEADARAVKIKNLDPVVRPRAGRSSAADSKAVPRGRVLDAFDGHGKRVEIRVEQDRLVLCLLHDFRVLHGIILIDVLPGLSGIGVESDKFLMDGNLPPGDHCFRRH